MFIVANREGLLALQKAIVEFLEKGRGVAEVYVADGDGYDVLVLLNDADWKSDCWRTLAVPYTSDYAGKIASSSVSDKIVWPWDLWNLQKGADKNAGN